MNSISSNPLISRIILLSFLISLIHVNPIHVVAQKLAEIDSLKQLLAGIKKDTHHVQILNELADKYYSIQPDSAFHFYHKAQEISEEIGFKKGMASSLRGIGTVQQLKGDNDAALVSLEKAMELYMDLGDKMKLATCYNNLGYTHKLKSEFDKAVEYFYKALEIADEYGNKRQMARTYNNIGSVHQASHTNERAIEAFEKALEIYMEIDYRNGVGICYVNLGITYFNTGDFEKALEYHEKALVIHQENNNKHGISICIGNMSEIYRNMGQFEKAIEYSLRSVELYEEMGFKEGIVSAFGNASYYHLQLADSLSISPAQRRTHLREAVVTGNKALELAREMNSWQYKSIAAHALMQAHKRLGNSNKSIEYAELNMIAKDSMFHEDKTNTILELETKYETDKKQQQLELQESQIIAQNATIKQQKTFRNALAAGFLAVVIIVLVFVNAYIQKKRANKMIMEQNEVISEANEELQQLNEEVYAQKEEIEAQRDHVFNQNMEITDSINYAQRIQSAMLPPESYINELLNENFILYRPRDIVSGDFYWIKQVNQYIVLVAADCTGHGVPGAFMSMLGISFLTEIVQRREITQANQVLNELRKQIKHSLRQHGGKDEAKDGIDMALCVIDLKNSMMQYAGANNSLYLIRDLDGLPELKDFKADRMPLGYYQGKDSSFTNHDIQLEPGDTFYVFSDGFVDQKGGKDNKRIMSKGFKSLLLEIQDLPMPDQKEKLDKTLTDWIGNNIQTDDVLVIGVRV